MYCITIRPIGLVNNTPKLLYFSNWLQGITLVRHIHTALKATYGINKLVDLDIPGTLTVRTKMHGDVATLELEEVPTDTNIKGALNGA